MARKLLFALIDIVFVIFSLSIATMLWYSGTIPGSTWIAVPQEAMLWLLSMSIIAPIIIVVMNIIFRLYNNNWKYLINIDIAKLFVSLSISYSAIFLVDYFLSNSSLELPKRLLLVSFIINFFLACFSRYGVDIIKTLFAFANFIFTNKSGYHRVMIIGSGVQACDLVRKMINKEVKNKIPIIMVEDERSDGSSIFGVKILPDYSRIVEYAEKYDIEEIIIALPTENSRVLNKVFDICSNTGCTLQILPPISKATIGSKHFIREVDINDLLSRDEVRLNFESLFGFFKDKTILVTGGGGSIGSEICRQVVTYNIKKLVIFDIYENNAFELYNEIKKNCECEIYIRIGSIRDISRLNEIFEEFRPNYVFHAAAHKHVGLMQDSPKEAVKNNIFGSKNVAECAKNYKCESFVLLSSDKAVNPTSFMGATKKVAELLVQMYNSQSNTKFIAVRFGNVLGSNGSIVPIFKQQIDDGGPLTVRHKEITRYFMTIQEACSLVLQAASLNDGGKIFVLEMGESIKILDLAEDMIKLAGLKPYKDIDIIITGITEGEKLHEELMTENEKEKAQLICDNQIAMIEQDNIKTKDLFSALEILEKVVNTEKCNIDQLWNMINDIINNHKV